MATDGSRVSGAGMAALPVDPRLARVLVEAGRTGCMDEALSIVSFLSIQDPRERPSDKTDAADAKHALFADERSDFVGVLNLWRTLARTRGRWQPRAASLVPRALPVFPAHAGMWATCASSSWTCRVHRRTAVATSLQPAPAVLSPDVAGGIPRRHRRAGRSPKLPRREDTRFVIAPGTPLAKRSPHWIVAASLVETHRLYARMVAQVQPSWINLPARTSLSATYGDAEWDASAAWRCARDGLALWPGVSSGRRVSFASVDPAAAQRDAVEEALVRRQPSMPFAFLIATPPCVLGSNGSNRACVGGTCWPAKTRWCVSTSSAFHRRWPRPAARKMVAYRRTGEATHRLDAAEQVFLAQPLPLVHANDYPLSLDVHGNALQLHYRFDATDPADGVTLDVPLHALGAVDAQRLEWLIPGWLREKVIALLRGLPKEVRREIVPIPDTADRLLAQLPAFGAGSLFAHVAAFATQAAGIRVAAEQVAAVALPPWLSINLRDLMGQGSCSRPGPQRPRGIARRVAGDVRRFDVCRNRAGFRVGARRRAAVGFCDLAGRDHGSQRPPATAGLSRHPGRGCERATAPVHDWKAVHGVRRGPASCAWRRWRCHNSTNWRAGIGRLTVSSRCCWQGRDSARSCSAKSPTGPWPTPVLGPTSELPRTRAQFEAQVERGRSDVNDRAGDIARIVKAVLLALKDVRARMSQSNGAPFAPARTSVNDQLAELLAPGWVRDTPDGWWTQLPKYVRAIARRLERARGDVERGPQVESQVEPVSSGRQGASARRRPRPARRRT